MLFDKKGNQSKGLILFGIFAPLLISAIFSVWGIKLTIESDKDRKQVEELTRLVKESQKNFDVLQKIYIASDSTSKSTMNLKQLPKKFSELSSTLDVLNGTLRKETEKIGKSYDALNDNYASLINQQKNYLDDISKVTKLTNEQVLALKKNNETIDNEFSRRPKINVECLIKNVGGLFYLNSINIQNSGNIECEMENFAIVLSPNAICKDSIDRKNPVFEKVKNVSNGFKLKIHEIQSRKLAVIRTNINFQNDCYFTSRDIVISYFFNYTSKYENNQLSGSASLIFE